MILGSARNWIAVNAVQRSSLNKKMKTKNMTTLHLKKSIGGSPSRLALLLIPLVFACFGLSPTARALLPPPAPDGGYLNGNTAEGSAALYHFTTGSSNTAVGADALSENDTGVARLSSASTSLRTSAPLRTQRHLNTLGNGHPTLFSVPKN